MLLNMAFFNRTKAFLFSAIFFCFFLLSETPLSSSKDGRDSYEKNLPLFFLISWDQAWDSNFINQFQFMEGSLARDENYLNEFSVNDAIKSSYKNIPELEKLFSINDFGIILFKGIHVPSLSNKTALDNIFGAYDAQNQYFRFGDLLASKLSPHFSLPHLYSISSQSTPSHKTSPYGIDLGQWLELEKKIPNSILQENFQTPFLKSQYKEILSQAPMDKLSSQRWKLYKYHDRITKFAEIHANIQSIGSSLSDTAIGGEFTNQSRYALAAMKAQQSIFASIQFNFPINKPLNDREKFEYFTTNIMQFIEDVKTLELNKRLYIAITAPSGKIWLNHSPSSEQKLSILWPETSMILLTPNTQLKYNIGSLNFQKLPKTNLELQNGDTFLTGEGLILDTQNTLNFPRIFSTLFKKLNAFDREIQGNLVEVKELRL